MQIISGRQFLFEKETYHTNETTGERVRVVETTVTVRAIPQAQVVPEWVADTDLFEQAVKDGTIVEVEIQGAAPKFGVDNDSKAGISGGAKQNFAPLANGQQQEQQQGQQQAQTGLTQGQQQTGWGK
jgi:hypothetical protein